MSRIKLNGTFEILADTNDLAQFRPRATVGTGPDNIVVANNGLSALRIGDAAVAGDPITQYIFGFEIPVIPKTSRVVAVEFYLFLESINQTGGTITHNCDLWNVGVGAPDPRPFAKWFMADATVAPGAYQTNASGNLVQNNILVPTTAKGIVAANAAGNAVIMSGMNAFYAAIIDQNKEYCGKTYLYFRINCDRAPTGGNTTSGYHIGHSGSTNPARLRVIVG